MSDSIPRNTIPLQHRDFPNHYLGRDPRRFPFWAIATPTGLRITAGCRDFSFAEAVKHWRDNADAQARLAEASKWWTERNQQPAPATRPWQRGDVLRCIVRDSSMGDQWIEVGQEVVFDRCHSYYMFFSDRQQLLFRRCFERIEQPTPQVATPTATVTRQTWQPGDLVRCIREDIATTGETIRFGQELVFTGQPHGTSSLFSSGSMRGLWLSHFVRVSDGAPWDSHGNSERASDESASEEQPQRTLGIRLPTTHTRTTATCGRRPPDFLPGFRRIMQNSNTTRSLPFAEVEELLVELANSAQETVRQGLSEEEPPNE